MLIISFLKNYDNQNTLIENLFDIQKWYNENLSDCKEVLLAYRGDITLDLISNVLDIIDTKLEGYRIEKRLQRKVYHVMVECLQNIYHYLDELDNGESKEFSGKFVTFFLSMNKNSFIFSCGNFIKAEKMKKLKERIDLINSLGKEELTELYRTILNNQEFSKSGGGGLGLIDVIRRTESRFDYHFYEYNKNYYFFNLKLLIE